MIDKPVLIESLNALKFSWKNGIEVELRRLTDKGEAEIWAWYRNGSTKPLLMNVSGLNLMAPRSVSSHATLLKNKTKDLDFDWNEAFDYITPMSLNAKRKGSEVIDLGTPGKTITKPTWDAFPFVVSGMTNILFGDRGSLKSKFAIILAIIMSLPMHDNELGIIAPDKSLKVLKLDFEATQDADEYELRRLLRGLDMEDALQIKYRACARPLADDVESIIDQVNNNKIDVVIVDSLGPAAGGDLNTTEPALKLNAALRQLNKTIIMTAHTAKNQIGKRSVFGSSFYENMARCIWEVTKEEDEESESDIQHIALRQTKSPPFAPHHKSLAFQFDFDQESERTIVTKYDPGKIASFQQHLSTGTKILSLLKEGKFNIASLTEELGEPNATIRQALFRLKKAGKITKIGEEYGLLQRD